MEFEEDNTVRIIQARLSSYKSYLHHRGIGMVAIPKRQHKKVIKSEKKKNKKVKNRKSVTEKESEKEKKERSYKNGVDIKS